VDHPATYSIDTGALSLGEGGKETKEWSWLLISGAEVKNKWSCTCIPCTS